MIGCILYFSKLQVLKDCKINKRNFARICVKYNYRDMRASQLRTVWTTFHQLYEQNQNHRASLADIHYQNWGGHFLVSNRSAQYFYCADVLKPPKSKTNTAKMYLNPHKSTRETHKHKDKWIFTVYWKTLTIVLLQCNFFTFHYLYKKSHYCQSL